MAAACSLLVDTGGLESNDAPPVNDSGAAPNDASDAAVIFEVSTDAPPDDSPAAPGCDSIVSDDFDHVDLGTNWSAVTTNGGTAVLTTATYVSGPKALEITLTPTSPTATPSVYLGRTFTKRKRVCCRFAVDADDAENGNTHHLFKLLGDGGNYDIVFTEEDGQLEIVEAHYSTTNPSFTHSFPKTTAPTGWKHIRFEAALPAGTGVGSFSLRIEDVVVVQGDLGTDIDDLSYDEVHFGSDYTQGAMERKLRYDDVGCGTF